MTLNPQSGLITEIVQSNFPKINNSSPNIGLIKKPEPNGYLSLHLIATIPFFLSENTELVTVKIQIRTIAIDFLASVKKRLPMT